MICCTVNNVIEFFGIDTCIYVWLHILLYTYLCVTRRVFEYHIWPSIRWNTKTSSSSCATVDGIVMADAQLNSMDFWGSCTGWQVAYNHLIGSIYGLYTRYILPSKGPHILPTTYHQNQKNPYIKRSSFFRWDEAGRTIVLQIWIDPGDPCFDSVGKKNPAPVDVDIPVFIGLYTFFQTGDHGNDDFTVRKCLSFPEKKRFLELEGVSPAFQMQEDFQH